MSTPQPLHRFAFVCRVALVVWFFGASAWATETAVEVSQLPTADGWTLGWRLPDQTPVYKTTPEGELRVHVFLPPERGADGADGEPVVQRAALVLFHGGGWVNGSPKAFYWQANALAERGMVVICPEYRLGEPHGTTPFDCVADAKSAIRYVRANAEALGIDPDRIAAGGGSAGGHIATCSAVLRGFDDPAYPNPEVSSRPDALVLWSPVLDTSLDLAGRVRPPARRRRPAAALAASSGRGRCAADDYF